MKPDKKKVILDFYEIIGKWENKYKKCKEYCRELFEENKKLEKLLRRRNGNIRFRNRRN